MTKKIIIGTILIVVLVIIVFFAYIMYTLFFTKVGGSPSYIKIDQCSPEVQTVINKYGIDKNKVEDCQSKSFKVGGKSVSFVSIAYGKASDCMAGCIFSHYCAVVENEKDYPFASYFINEEENILKMPMDYSGDVDKSVLTGKNHSLASSPEFIEFLNKSWCKN